MNPSLAVPTQRPTVALFGGSFDPPHVSHVLAVAYVLSAEAVDAVWIEPVARHPLGKAPVSFEHRLAMCALAFGWLGPRVQVRRDEEELGGDGRTIDLIAHLRAAHPGTDLRLILGTDQIGDRHLWKDFDRVLSLAPPIMLGRPGHPASADLPARVELPAVSSSRIRAVLARGADARGLIPTEVLGYIRRHGLYQEVP